MMRPVRTKIDPQAFRLALRGAIVALLAIPTSCRAPVAQEPEKEGAPAAAAPAAPGLDKKGKETALGKSAADKSPAQRILDDLLAEERKTTQPKKGTPAAPARPEVAPEGDRDVDDALVFLAKAGKGGPASDKPPAENGPAEGESENRPAEKEAEKSAKQPEKPALKEAPEPPRRESAQPSPPKDQPEAVVTRGGPPAAPVPAAPAPVAAPAPAPAAAAAAAAAQEPPAAQHAAGQNAKPPRPPGKTAFYTFFHKRSDEFLTFLRDRFADMVEKGHVAAVDGKPMSVVFIGDDPIIQLLSGVANDFDDLGIEDQIQRTILRPKFIDVAVAMEAMNMAGVANVWNRVEENITTNWLGADGKVQKTATHKQSVYSKAGLSFGQTGPVKLPAKIPYIFEMPWTEPFNMPPQSTGKTPQEQLTIAFNNTSSTERRGQVVAVGTRDDLDKIQAFMDQIDKPARLIMIEVQLIEIDASKFSDIGTDSFQAGARHTIVGGSLNLPGEPLSQPGIPGVPKRLPAAVIPPNVVSGITGMFDDTTVDLPGRFMANVHLLVRTGDAKVKARPKILALDDRPSILHIGEEIPTFESTGVSRELTGGNFVEQVNKVTTQYVGFTLNMRPKVSGEKDDEIALQLEVVSNKLQGRERVFEEDLLGVPNVTRRRFIGQTRVRNHRPIILGGLIQEEESESVNKLPILGEIPLVKFFFSRRQKTEERIEVILVLTPHILSEGTPDRIATPKESVHFDTFDSVLFNDRHIVKGRDVQGIDPISKQPAKSADGKVFTEAEVVDLTLLKIVKDRKLVSKLGIFDEYMPVESQRLGWLERKFPERSVFYWRPDKQEVYYKAAAIVIENIKELNADLTYEDLVRPRREIVLPTTPYRMTLSYDKYRILKESGQDILRGERVELSQATVELLKEIAVTRSTREFADFIEKGSISAESHGGIRRELENLMGNLQPEKRLDPGLTYPQLYRELAGAQIDFMVMATYFQDNLSERYRTLGAPDIGTFERDLVNFLKTTVTITQRARRLRDLEGRWAALYGDDPDAPVVEAAPVEEGK